jgi:hypothetical protein
MLGLLNEPVFRLTKLSLSPTGYRESEEKSEKAEKTYLQDAQCTRKNILALRIETGGFPMGIRPIKTASKKGRAH